MIQSLSSQLKLVSLSVLLCFAALAARNAAAAYVVTNSADGGPGSLREGIASGNPVINIGPNLICHTIVLTNELVIGDNLTINGPGPAFFGIDGNRKYRVFRILPGVSVTISNLTIKSGADLGASGVLSRGETARNGMGGGIYNEGLLNIVNCGFIGNSVTGGNSYSSPTRELGGLAGSGLGGAIYNAGTLKLRDSSLTENSCEGGFGGIAGNGTGGAIFSLGALLMVNCTISGNQVLGGGDLDSHGGFGTGGGIASFTNLSLINCTISSNFAFAYLGGVTEGGGLITTNLTTNATYTNAVRNTIIAGNWAGTGLDVHGAVVSQGYNFIGITNESTGWITSGPAMDRMGGIINGFVVGKDPLLGPLRFYGGQTRCHALRPESQAIDNGDDTVIGTPVLNLTTDQRGAPLSNLNYPRKVGAHVDIGAFEWDSSTHYTVFACAVMPDFAHTPRDLVIDMSNGDTMNFAPDITGTYFIDEELIIDKSINIVGPGAGVLTFCGTGSNRLFNVLSNATVSVSGLTFANGSSPSGGAISNAATLTLTDCVLSNNAATSGAGGALYNSGSLTLERCAVVGNRATLNGGGMMNEGTMRVNNSTLMGNTSSDKGGAIYHLAGSGILFLEDCTITGNHASFTSLPAGGGIYAGSCFGANCSPFPPEVWSRNCIVAGNTSVQGPDCAGPVISLGYNLIGNGADSAGFESQGDQVGNGPAPLDPMLGPLQDNGGPTPTMALLAGSPAINRGYSPTLSSDQRGGRRRIYGTTKVAIGDGSDIGAYEVDGLLRMTSIERLTPTGIGVSFLSESASSYSVERSSALGSATWTTLIDNIPGTGGVVQVIDPDSTQAQRFYRVRLLP